MPLFHLFPDLVSLFIIPSSFASIVTQRRECRGGEYHHGDVLKTEQLAAVLRSPQVGNVKTGSKKGAQVFAWS